MALPLLVAAAVVLATLGGLDLGGMLGGAPGTGGTDASAPLDRQRIEVPDARVEDPVGPVAAGAPPRDCRSDPGPCVSWRAAHGPGLAAVGVDDVVVVVEPSGEVVARDRTDGTERWRTRAPGLAAVGRGPAADALSPGAGDVELVATVGGTVAVRAGQAITFLDAAEGGRVGAARLTSPATDAVASGPWLLVAGPDEVAALGVTGSVTWRRAIPDDARAVLHAHGAYLATDDAVTRLSPNTGQDRWTAAVGDAPRPLAGGSPDGRLLVAVDGGPDDLGAGLVGLDADDGTVAWRAELGVVREVVAGDDRLVVAVASQGGGLDLAVLAPVAGGGATPPTRHRQVRLTTADEVAQLGLLGRQPVLITGGDAPELILATPDGFARVRQPVAPGTRIGVHDGRLLVVGGDAVVAVEVTTGVRRLRLPLPGARTVPGAPGVVAGDTTLVGLGPLLPR